MHEWSKLEKFKPDGKIPPMPSFFVINAEEKKY